MKLRALFFLPTIAAIAVGSSIVFPDRTPFIASLAAIAALGYVLMELNASARRLVLEEPSRFDRALDTQEPEPAVPQDLKRSIRAFGWGSYEPGYFDFRVRPVLRELIHFYVKERQGIDLTREFASARGRVAPELLNLFGDVRAERLYHGNIHTADIERMVTLIEDV